MLAFSFDIRFDVSLTLQLSDLSDVFEEMESRLQRTIAPKLTDCPGSRRWLNDSTNRRLAIEPNVVGNAQFFLEYQPNQACDSSAPFPCYRGLARLDVYLKRAAEMLSFANQITGVLNNGDLRTALGLTAPFEHIEVVEIAASAPTSSPVSPPCTSPTTSSPVSPPYTSPTTSSPVSPTGYETNSTEACDSIAIKESVPNQGTMTARSFDIRLDVSLTLQLSDLSEVVEVMESRLQRIIAPKLAECPGSRRWLSEGNNRKLAIEPNAVGNAQFFLEYQPNQACDSSAPFPCYRGLARLDVYLKRAAEMLSLANHISMILFSTEDLTTPLGLTAPFSSIEVVGVTSAS